MSNKATKDAIKHAAKLMLRGEVIPVMDEERVDNAAAKIAKRNNRLSLVRQSRRATRAERSLRRRAQEWQQGKRLAEALVNA